MGKVTYAVIVLLAIGTYYVLVQILSDGEFTGPVPDYYFGPLKDQSKKEDVTIRPFKINIDERLIQDLQSKLQEENNSSRITPPMEGVGFGYGFNTKYLKTVVNYWLTKYDWRHRERLLNQYPQFKTKIAGINIHFQHVKSGENSKKYKKTLPLLVLHGWPGSFVEMHKIIPFLTDPLNSDLNFELVIPSLPGYGFSDGATRPGLNLVAVSQILTKLMSRLGHEKFYVQGGDWGAFIALTMATVYSKNVIAMHSNLCQSNHPRSLLRGIASEFFPSIFMTPEEADRFLPFSNYLILLIRETGYLHLQASKPDTIGVALSHSPSGLAAYILEKYSSWTSTNFMDREDGGIPLSAFTMDELLDNVMIYWVTSSITTSMRFYKENILKLFGTIDNIPVKIPVGCLVPRNEPYIGHTKAMIEEKYQNLLSYNYAKVGGHFIAMEHPQVLAEDVFSFINQVESLPNVLH